MMESALSRLRKNASGGEQRSYIWKRGIFSGGIAREVSRNLQADKYMSNSGWEKFTGPFLSWAPRTTLASLSRAQIKADKKLNYFWKGNGAVSVDSKRLTLRRLYLPVRFSPGVWRYESSMGR